MTWEVASHLLPFPFAIRFSTLTDADALPGASTRTLPPRYLSEPAQAAGVTDRYLRTKREYSDEPKSAIKSSFVFASGRRAKRGSESSDAEVQLLYNRGREFSPRLSPRPKPVSTLKYKQLSASPAAGGVPDLPSRYVGATLGPPTLRNVWD